MQWNESWNLGIATIDGQHRNILKAINALQTASGPKMIPKLLQALTAYALIHFDYEINLLEENDFKDLIGHKREHENFFLQIREFSTESQEEPDLEEFMERVRIYLVNWLFSHIQEVDMQYRDHLLARGIK